MSGLPARASMEFDVVILGTGPAGLAAVIRRGQKAVEVLVEDGKVVGVATGDMGGGRDSELNAVFARSVELRAKYAIFGENARNSLTKQRGGGNLSMSLLETSKHLSSGIA